MSVRAVWRNIPLEGLHRQWRESLLESLPILHSSSNEDYLSLYRFIGSSPEKFYSQPVAELFLDFLENTLRAQRAELSSYLTDNHERLNQAYYFLKEVNAAEWHEEIDSVDDFERLRFIDKHVHPTYLRVLEAVFLPFVHMVAWFSRVNRGAGTDGLDLYNACNELAGTLYEPLCAPYHHLVRNGIGHGGVLFGNNEIRYTDKKGNTDTILVSEVIRLVDDLLDTCNGLSLASRLFFLSSRSSDIRAPEQILLEELFVETESPWWSIEGTVRSMVPQGSQLIIYARPKSSDSMKIHFYTFLSAALAEYYTPGYDRYFFSLRSKGALPGFAAFDGEELARIGKSQPTAIGDYRTALESDLLFYRPRWRLPRIFGSIGSFWNIALINIRLFRETYRKQFSEATPQVRIAKIHRNGAWSVLNGAVVLSSLEGLATPESRVRVFRKVVSSALREARRQCPRTTVLRYLPLGWARISVLQRDYRKRRIESFGLTSDLICTVQVSRLSRIKAPDIFFSTIENYGRYRVAWNREWVRSSTDHDPKSEDLESPSSGTS